MKATFNQRSNNYHVEITKEDLEKAFSSELNYYQFLYDIVRATYGIQMAEIMYGNEIAQRLKEIDKHELL